MHHVDAKAILSSNNGMNIYRGCGHGCVYCDSRSLCYGMDHIFEDIEVKQNAIELLDLALSRKRKKCMIGTGSMSDPYMPLEKTELMTRRALEVANRRGFGFSVITKSDLLLRDLDLITSINDKTKFVAQITLTTSNDALCHVIEPNVCPTSRRYEVLKELQRLGVPTVVWLSPFLPFINDTEENLLRLLDMCFDAGVIGILCFGIGLTLRAGNREYFYKKLDESFPGFKARYIEEFGISYSCMSRSNDRLMRIFHFECEKRGVIHDIDGVFSYLHEFEEKHIPRQTSLFD